jgi:hypothetical protein
MAFLIIDNWDDWFTYNTLYSEELPYLDRARSSPFDPKQKWVRAAGRVVRVDASLLPRKNGLPQAAACP